MKASTLLGLIAVVAIIYAARVGLRTLIGSASQGVSPTCLELVGKTTREDEGRTYIVGSVRNDCTRKYGSVTVVFKLDRRPGPTESLPQGIAYAYIRDLVPGETRPFKSAFPVSRDTTFLFDAINAY
jgi:hypothetical protein